MARTPNFTISQREAAQRIPDVDVEQTDIVIEARQALAEAESAYAKAMGPRRAALQRLQALQAELAAVRQQRAEADARRAEVALAVTDGEVSGGAYHALLELLDEYRVEAERIELSIPALEARYHAHSAPTERAAQSESDAQVALADAIQAAKLDLAVAQGA